LRLLFQLSLDGLKLGKFSGHVWISWWYFDSTSFPYPSLWRFLFQFFSMRWECRDMRDAAVHTRATRVHNKKNQGFPGFFLFFMNFANV
jgi:hypothetical protein